MLLHTPPSLQGKVLRYHEDEGTLEMTASEYISLLEMENTALRKEVCLLLRHTALTRSRFMLVSTCRDLVCK